MPSKTQCSKCGSPEDANHAECSQCGARVIRTCGDCGFQNSPAKRYCDQCGISLNADSKRPAEPADRRAASEENARKPAPPEPLERPPVRLELPATEPDSRPTIDLPQTLVRKLAPSSGSAPLELHRESGALPDAGPDRIHPESATPAPVTSNLGTADATAAPREAAQGSGGGKQPPSATSAGMYRPPQAPPARQVKKQDRAPLRGPATFGPRTLLSSPLAAKASTALALALLIAGAGVWVVRSRRAQAPDFLVPATARRYLSALRSGRIESAYSLLSDASRRHCTLDAFRQAQAGPAWDFSAVALESLEDELASVRYVRTTAGGAPEENRLVFIREQERWSRAFLWDQLRRIEDAFGGGRVEEALDLARAARSMNPRDPAAQASVCEAVYHLRDPRRAADVVRECRLALDMDLRAPAALSLPGAQLAHVRAVLADAYKNVLGRHADALEEYSALLVSPDVAPAEQCEALLGRAGCRLAIEDYRGAVEDLATAAGRCQAPADVDYARLAASVYSGAAGSQAVLVAQRHRPEPGGPTLFERQRSRAPATRRSRGKGAPAPSEEWLPTHVKGSLYRVELRQGGAVVLSARVDMAGGSVRMEAR